MAERAEQHPTSWPGVGPRPAHSDLGLEVNDVLANQWDGGTRLLPLYAPQLQWRRGQWLQLLLYPGRCPVGLAEALPGPLVGSLLLLWLLKASGVVGAEEEEERRALRKGSPERTATHASQSPNPPESQQKLQLP